MNFSETVFNKSLIDEKNISWRNLTIDERILITKQYFKDNFNAVFDNKKK